MRRKQFVRTALTGCLVLTLVLGDMKPVQADTVKDGETVTANEEMEENTQDVIVISSKDEFLSFAKECQLDVYSFGKVFSLEEDLDLSGEEFYGVPYFEGTFLGNGHTVSGIRIDVEGSDYGFFRYLGTRAHIKELHISGEVIMAGSAVNVGGIVGVNRGTVSNCSFKGTITGITSAGGIAGCNKEGGILLDCSVEGTVTATDATGGICGLNEGIIKDCSNVAVVNGEDLKPTLDLGGIDLGNLNVTRNVVTRNDMGGIAGISTGTISDCTNTGNIGFAHAGYNVGGITGRQSGTIIGCTNQGSILGRKDVGGIVGQAEPFMESEYLSDRLERIREDFNRINHLVVQMSNAVSTTSAETKQYTQTLQKQYEDTIDSLNRQINSLQGTIAANDEQTKAYIESLNQSLQNMGQAGNDAVMKMWESTNAQNQLKDWEDELESKLQEESSSSEESLSAQESSSSEESSSSQEGGGSGENANNGLSNDGEPEEPEGIGDSSRTDASAFHQLSAPTESSTAQESSSSQESSSHAENISSAASSVADDIENAVNDPKVQADLNMMQNELISATDSIKNMQNALTNTSNSVSDTAGNIADELSRNSKNSGKTIEGMAASVDSGIQSVTSSINGIMSTSDKISNYIGEDIDILLGNGSGITDVSSVNITENTLGIVSDCNNYGKVEADINTGGIAGAMNVEYEIDPELDFDLTGITDVTVRVTVNNVLIHCQNYGTVKIKKNNCGGIAGSSELGIIYDCENYGNLQSDNGKKMGGIVGMSSSSIGKSYAFCNIEGTDYIGGICGEGYNISNCISLSTLICEGGECLGSIAGTVDKDSEVAGNYFSVSETGGIDNISYAGKAEPCTYEQIMKMEGVPQGFEIVTVTFEKEDELLGTLKLPYGSSLTEEMLPEMESGEDVYLKWGVEFPLENVTENITITAKEERWICSVGSKEKNNEGRSFVLAEGKFYEDSELKLAGNLPEIDGINETLVYAYTWEVNNLPKEMTETKLHLLIPDGYDNTRVFVQEKTGWEEVEKIMDGSYAVVKVPYGAAFAVYGEKNSPMLYYIGGVFVVCILLFSFVMGKIKKHKRKKMDL